MTKRITEPRKRTRTVQIKFWATPEEKELIEKKMALTGIVHLGAYLRKMAIDGYAVNLQIPELKDILRYQRYANNNINQIAKKVNATGSIYAEDVEEIRQRVDGIYDQIDKLITKIAKINKRRNGAQPQKNSASKGTPRKPNAVGCVGKGRVTE